MADDVNFRVDLIQQTLHHLNFLKTVYKLKVLHERPVLQSAIRRYEEKWLPLAADHPDECLSAPLDIEWAWHCHMLAPQKYAKTCRDRFSIVINHSIRVEEEYEVALLTSEKYWREKYPDETDWFRFDKLGQALSFKAIRKTSLYYSLARAMERQISFYYQVSLPHFRDKKFLIGALDRYRKFLYLKSTLPDDQAVVPCFDIDLIWHTHQLHPAAYDKDTRGLLGYMLDHDDDIEGVRKSGQLDNDTVTTTRHWQELFKEPFTRVGVAYRGMNPVTHFEKQDYHFKLMGIKVNDILIDEISLSMSDIDREADLNTYSVCIWRHADEKFIGKVTPATIPDTSGSVSCQVVFDKPLHFATPHNNNTLELHIELFQICQITCFKHTRSLGKTVIQIRLSSLVYHLADRHQDFYYCEWGHLGPGMTIRLHETVTTTLSDMSQLVFQLDEGPVQREEVDMPKRILGTDKEQCLVALHNLRYGAGGNGRTFYQARVLHALSSGAFLVQIVQKDILKKTTHEVAAVHLIGQDQMPRPDQVEEADRCITLDPARQEQALLIKSRTGDWGVVTGRPTRLIDKDQSSIQSDSLEINFWKLPSGQRTSCQISSDHLHGRLLVRTPWVSVDLAYGMITMDSANVLEMGEHLAFAFAVCLMTMMYNDGSQGSAVLDTDPPPPINPLAEDGADEHPDCARAEELSHGPDWNMRKFFRACALGQSSLPNRRCSAGSEVNLAGASGMSEMYSYEYLKGLLDGIEKQKRNIISRRKAQIESRSRESRHEQDDSREREDNYWRNVKHPAGMCLGCGPSGCRGHR